MYIDFDFVSLFTKLYNDGIKRFSRKGQTLV